MTALYTKTRFLCNAKLAFKTKNMMQSPSCIFSATRLTQPFQTTKKRKMLSLSIKPVFYKDLTPIKEKNNLIGRLPLYSHDYIFLRSFQRTLTSHTCTKHGYKTQYSLSHTLKQHTCIDALLSRCVISIEEISQALSTIGALFKWKLSLWVTLSTLPGYIMASAIPSCACITFPSIISLMFGTFLCSGGANAFNQIIERHRDARMIRTCYRPIPSGKMNLSLARIVAWTSSGIGSFVLLYGTNYVTAFLGVTTILTYTLLYTPLKVKTCYNTHVGAIIGSIPTLMGFSAAGESLYTIDPWVLFTIQTLWQFPHFYGLAWRYREDYRRGGFLSFPLSDSTGHVTAALIRPYIFAMSMLPFITYSYNLTGAMLLIDGGIANTLLWLSFRQFEKKPDVTTSSKFFVVSLWHLLILLTLSVFHSRLMYESAKTTQTREQKIYLEQLELCRKRFERWCIHSNVDFLSTPAVCPLTWLHLRNKSI